MSASLSVTFSKKELDCSGFIYSKTLMSFKHHLNALIFDKSLIWKHDDRCLHCLPSWQIPPSKAFQTFQIQFQSKGIRKNMLNDSLIFVKKQKQLFFKRNKVVNYIVNKIKGFFSVNFFLVWLHLNHLTDWFDQYNCYAYDMHSSFLWSWDFCYVNLNMQHLIFLSHMIYYNDIQKAFQKQINDI